MHHDRVFSVLSLAMWFLAGVEEGVVVDERRKGGGQAAEEQLEKQLERGPVKEWRLWRLFSASSL
jgi:hypothetical protein